MARISFAEDIFRKRNGRFGTLHDLIDLQPGLPASLMDSGRMGDYSLTIEFSGDGYTARANPDNTRRRLTAFYADQTGRITINRSGQPAGPESLPMSPADRSLWQRLLVLAGIL